MTSTTMTFDTLMYAKKLKQVGFTEEQAKVQAEALADMINEKLTTKQDLKELEMHLIFKLASINMVVVGLFTGLLGVFIKLVH